MEGKQTATTSERESVHPFVAAGAAAAPSGPIGDVPSNPSAGAADLFVGGEDPFGWSSPFAAGPSHEEVAPDAPEGSYTYQLVKTGPAVPSEEVETPAASVEVMILWGQTVLHVSHLTPPRSFHVGEEASKSSECDYFLPSSMLAATRAPVVLADRGGAVFVVIPQRARGTIELPGQPKMTVQQAIEGGKTQSCAELAGAHQMQLPNGSKAKIEIGSLVFQVSSTNAGRAVAGRFPIETPSVLHTGLSAAVHLGLLAAMTFFMPPLVPPEGGVSQDQQELIARYLQTAAEKEIEREEAELVAANDADDDEGGTGTRTRCEEGSMGSPNTKATSHRFGLSVDSADPQYTRAAALRDAAEFGMFTLAGSGGGGDPGAPTVPWGRDESYDGDLMSARGRMWREASNEWFDAGIFDLSGIGEGGIGRDEGIDVSFFATIGPGAGAGTGRGFGGGLGGSYRAKRPHVRLGATSVSGRLPPEVVQRIVRPSFGRFRFCYENALRHNPSLEGRIAVRFVIGRDGAVSNVGNAGSDLPDVGLVSCVVRSFHGLSFPRPDDGIVRVVYPILFTPGG